MRRRIILSLLSFVCLASLLGATAVTAHPPDRYMITPDKSTMLIGESRVFRMVNQNGQTQHNVTWTISNVDAFMSTQGDELWASARKAGEYRLTARTDFAVAEGSITVVERSQLQPGTVLWSSGSVPGCTTTRIIPAVPTPNGPALFQQSICEDGQYLAAYTSNGVQLWRRKLSSYGAPVEPTDGGNNYEVIGNSLEPHPASICDSVTVGMPQDKIRELLTQRGLEFREQPSPGHVWLVEQSNTQCKLWFDEKSVLARKKKIFVTD